MRSPSAVAAAAGGDEFGAGEAAVERPSGRGRRRLRAATFVRRQAYMAAFGPAQTSVVQASTVASRASSRVGAIWMRSCVGVPGDGVGDVAGAEAGARAARSPGSSWRTFSSRTWTMPWWRLRRARSAPPGPTGPSWRSSPTRTTFALARSQAVRRRSSRGRRSCRPRRGRRHVAGSRSRRPWSRRQSSEAIVRLSRGRLPGRGCGRPGRRWRCR